MLGFLYSFSFSASEIQLRPLVTLQELAWCSQFLVATGLRISSWLLEAAAGDDCVCPHEGAAHRGPISCATCRGGSWAPGGARGPRSAPHGMEIPRLSLLIPSPRIPHLPCALSCSELDLPFPFTDQACRRLRMIFWGLEFTDLCGCRLLPVLLPVRILELSPVTSIPWSL